MAERNLDFDKTWNRKNTHSLKFDFAKRRGYPEDILPLWVADMDLKTSSYVEDALSDCAKRGIFGYSETGAKIGNEDDYFKAVSGWLKRHHDFDVEFEWLIKTPGVVFALAMAIKAYTNPGDGVLISQPVYYPFSEVIEDNGRVVVSSDLYLGDDNRYHYDYEDFEKKIDDNNIKLFILCNPHNPVGRVWDKEELIRLGDICLKKGVIVVSDEIHSDFDLYKKHNVFAALKEEYKGISITCTSVSKTFNLASLLISNVFIPDKFLRKKFKKEVDGAGISQLSIFGIEGTISAYNDGEEWYQKMISYVKGNIEFVREYVSDNLPGVKLIDTEGTYLVWLDFRDTGIDANELDRRIIYEANLWLDSGKIFGDTGKGFQRINVATQRSVLKEALDRIKGILY